jgi:hypothetical protein
MKPRSFLYAAALAALFGGMMEYGYVRAQTGGDQIVDGIGETSLVARYTLDASGKDRSRDSHDATIHGGTFVDDKQFGKVLSLTGESGSYVELPANSLAEADTLSVVGWVNLKADAAGQVLFDFGKSNTARITAALTGSNGYSAKINNQGVSGGAPIAKDKWVHVAIVLDGAAKTLTLYADGAKVAQEKNLTATLDQAIDKNNADAN